MTAQQSTAVEVRRADRWRWLYWLSVALFLSAASMPYVVVWLWERGLIVKDRPWEYYDLEVYYLSLFISSLILLSAFKLLTRKHLYVVFMVLSILFMLNRNSENEVFIFNKEVSTIVAIGFVYISFLMSFSEKLYRIEFPWKWLIYVWRTFLGFVFVFVFLFLGGYVYSPYPGVYYTPDSGYLSIYDYLVKYKYQFLDDIDSLVKVKIKNNKIPDDLLPNDFLCRVEKMYDKIIECARSKLSSFMKNCARQEGDGVKIRIYFDREGNGPYVVVYYERKRLVDTSFYGWIPEHRLNSKENEYVTYCQKGEKERKEEVDHER